MTFVLRLFLLPFFSSLISHISSHLHEKNILFWHVLYVQEVAVAFVYPSEWVEKEENVRWVIVQDINNKVEIKHKQKKNEKIELSESCIYIYMVDTIYYICCVWYSCIYRKYSKYTYSVTHLCLYLSSNPFICVAVCVYIYLSTL